MATKYLSISISVNMLKAGCTRQHQLSHSWIHSNIYKLWWRWRHLYVLFLVVAELLDQYICSSCIIKHLTQVPSSQTGREVLVSVHAATPGIIYLFHENIYIHRGVQKTLYHLFVGFCVSKYLYLFISLVFENNIGKEQKLYRFTRKYCCYFRCRAPASDKSI